MMTYFVTVSRDEIALFTTMMTNNPKIVVDMMSTSISRYKVKPQQALIYNLQIVCS